MVKTIVPILVALSFNLAWAGDDQNLSLGSQIYKPIGTTSSHDFSDVTYQLISEEGESDGFAEQFLRIAIAKNRQTLIEMERPLLSAFSGEATTREQAALESHDFEVRESQVLAKDKAVPELVVLTAIEMGKADYHVGIQYTIKTRCPNCLEKVALWKEQFTHAMLNDDASVLSLPNGGSINLDGLAFTASAAEKGYFRSFVDGYTAYVMSLAVPVGTAVFYGGKLILGVMGYNGPCGNNLALCKCGP